MERRSECPLLAHWNPQVDGSAQFLDFPGFSAPQKVPFHVMDCMVCMRQVPARSRLLVAIDRSVRGLRGVYGCIAEGLRSGKVHPTVTKL